MPRVWVVRAGDENELAASLEEKKLVAVGWSELGNISAIDSRQALLERMKQVYPQESERTRSNWASQLFTFARDVQIGDTVLTPQRARRTVLVGRVSGEYRFDLNESGRYPNVRDVQWLKVLSRDDFSKTAKNSLGALQTVFNVDGLQAEIQSLAEGAPTPVAVESDYDFYADTKSKAEELIRDALARIDPYEFQDLVAGVLRTMGFNTKVSPPGRDQGIDIIAHPDALGFERPRIKAQVKHRKSQAATGPEMRSLVGTLQPDEKGLFVSSAGFTPDAVKEAEKNSSRVAALDGESFVELLLERYEQLEPSVQALIPLRRIYIPVRS